MENTANCFNPKTLEEDIVISIQIPISHQARAPVPPRAGTCPTLDTDSRPVGTSVKNEYTMPRPSVMLLCNQSKMNSS